MGTKYSVSNTGVVTLTNDLIVDTDVLKVDTTTNRVGLGTTAPYTRLSAASANASDVPVLGTSAGSFTLANNALLYGLQGGVLSSGNSWLQSGRHDGTATAYNILLQPVGGFVGIGTDTPGEELEVKGNIRVKKGIASNDPAYETRDLSDNILHSFRVSNGAGGTGNDLVIRAFEDIHLAPNNSDTALFTLKASGNVGVGTTAPDALIESRKDVVGGAIQLLLSNRATPTIGNTCSIVFGPYSSSYTAEISAVAESASAATALAFYTHNGGSYTEKVRIKNTGEFGVGTASPANTLHLNSSASLDAIIRFDIGGSAKAYFGAAQTAGNIITGSAIGDMCLRVFGGSGFRVGGSAATTLFSVLDSGDVGIGVAPSYKLHVAGDINTTTMYRVGGTQIAAANLSDGVPNTRTISAGTGMTGGGDLSANRTLTLANTAVTPATYGNGASIPQITVDQQGRLTAVTGVTVNITSTHLDVTGATAGSFGSATAVATYTVDTKGRLTASGSTSIQISESQVTNLTTDLGNKTDKTTLTTTGDIYYASSANTPARLGIGSSAQVLTVSGGLPVWAASAAGGSGSVVNMTQTTVSAVVSTTGLFPNYDNNSVHTISHGTEVMTHSFTPSNASNILYIEVGANICSNSARRMMVALYQDAVTNALAVQREYNGASSALTKATLVHKMTAGTTSAITFRVRIGDDNTGANTSLNGVGGAQRDGGQGNSYIRVTEVKA